MDYHIWQILVGVGIVAVTFEYKDWKQKKYMIRNIALILLLILSTIFGFIGIINDKTKEGILTSKNRQDSIVNKARYDSIYNKLTECRNTTNTTNYNYYQTILDKAGIDT